MLFLKKDFSMLIILAILLSVFTTVISAESTEYLVGTTSKASWTNDSVGSGSSWIENVDSQSSHCIEFRNIAFFDTVSKVTIFMDGYLTEGLNQPSKPTNLVTNIECRVDSETGAVIGEASHVFWSYDYQSEQFILTVIFESFDTTGLTGTRRIYLVDLPSDFFKGLQLRSKENWYYAEDWACAFGYGTVHTVIANSISNIGNHRSVVEATYTFNNQYVEYINAAEPYWRLDVLKNYLGDNYTSQVQIWSENYTYITEESQNSNNITIFPMEIPVYLSILDQYDRYYNETVNFAPILPADDGIPNILSGTVVNAVDNTLLDGVILYLNSTTGYGGNYQDTSSLGFYEITNIIDDNYNLSVNHPSFEPYQRDLELTEDLTLNIPLIPTDQVTLGTNLSGVYGIVSDYYTEQPVSNVIVRIENSTYSDFTSTNNNGYYEFVNITAGNYTVEGNKVEYYPYQQKNLTTTANDMLVHNFDMVLLVEPVETVSDELEDALGLDEVTEEDILHFLKTYGFWLFILALIFFMYAAYKSSGIDRWF